MSTVVVVRKGGQAVIGADTLTKLGCTKEPVGIIRNYSKIVRIADSYLAVVGHASFDLVLKSYFSSLTGPPDFSSVQAIFEEARKMHGALKEHYFLNPKEQEEDEFESTRTDFLIANRFGIFGLHSLRSVSEYERFYAFGSGYRVALGAMHAVYGRAKTAREAALAGLEAAAAFDDSTDRPFELRTMRLV